MNPKNVYKNFRFIPTFQLQIPECENETTVAPLVFTLDSVAYLLSRFIPTIKSKSLTIVLCRDNKFPQCFREIKLIFLNCGIYSWAQAAYQFAHELCHYAIPYAVHPKLRWLEESICQVSSLFFLCYMADFWRSSGVSYTTTSGTPYYNAFLEYAKTDSAKATPFNFQDPAEISSLETDCYQREKNSYIANQLLPIFKEHPDLWAAVPALYQIQQPRSLQTALDEWLQAVPRDLHQGLLEIRALFVP